MPFADFVQTLRSEIGDPEGILLDDSVLGRCLTKAVFRLARDLAIPLAVDSGEITPEPIGETLELLILLGFIHACQLMRARTANAFSFSSGDKRVDKTSQPEHWAKLEADLEELYRRRLAQVRPESTSASDDVIFRPTGLGAVLYEQGKELDEACS